MASAGDVILIHLEDEPALFARIEEISADRKPDWYRVRLLVLQLPLTEIVWILRAEYIDGEPFTMNGHGIRLEKVDPLAGSAREGAAAESDGQKRRGSASENVISIFDRKRG